MLKGGKIKMILNADSLDDIIFLKKAGFFYYKNKMVYVI